MNVPPAPSTPGGRDARRARRWWALAGAGVLALTAVGVLAAWFWPRKAPPPKDPFALPPISSSPYLNTGPTAHYVGSEACYSCHKDEHASFACTGMSRSMATVDLDREPLDAAFDHPASKTRFQIVRKDGALWHRELLRTDGPQEVLLAEYPVKYVVGSGRHALTYLVETDGFLVESPATWYPTRKTWDMSPGYDHPTHLEFSRAVGEACLYCHAGRSESIGASLHKMKIDEISIGCERCHGPGSLHVELRKGRGLPPGEPDFTIVNPSRLSRELSEAVCQQCHLKSAALLPARGRKQSDYRPGLPLQDFRQDYGFTEEDRSMKVVGHVEQMHLSRCYQSSDSLTCLTCHNPHGEPASRQKTAYYNSICTGCHEPQRCRVDPQRRERESPQNNCVQCHMPRSPTDIPHLAFTHHRIGVYNEPPTTNTAGPRKSIELRPFLKLPPMSEADQKRSLGLAYVDIANRETEEGTATRCRKRALELLTAAHDAGLKDPDLDAELAQVCWDLKTGGAAAYAESALAQPGLAGQSRCDALEVLAESEAQDGDFADAVKALTELTQLRRHPHDQLILSNCEQALGDEAAMVEARNAAVRLSPRLWPVHRYLADYYRQHGDAQQAAWHELRAVH